MNKTKILKGIYLLSLIVLGVMLVYTAIHTEIEYNRLIEVSVLVGIGVVLATFGLLSIEFSKIESQLDKLDKLTDKLTDKLAWLTEDDKA